MKNGKFIAFLLVVAFLIALGVYYHYKGPQIEYSDVFFSVKSMIFNAKIA